jgi:hypothetical protein
MKECYLPSKLNKEKYKGLFAKLLPPWQSNYSFNWSPEPLGLGSKKKTKKHVPCREPSKLWWRDQGTAPVSHPYWRIILHIFLAFAPNHPSEIAKDAFKMKKGTFHSALLVFFSKTLQTGTEFTAKSYHMKFPVCINPSRGQTKAKLCVTSRV